MDRITITCPTGVPSGRCKPIYNPYMPSAIAAYPVRPTTPVEKFIFGVGRTLPSIASIMARPLPAGVRLNPPIFGQDSPRFFPVSSLKVFASQDVDSHSDSGVIARDVSPTWAPRSPTMSPGLVTGGEVASNYKYRSAKSMRYSPYTRSKGSSTTATATATAKAANKVSRQFDTLTSSVITNAHVDNNAANASGSSSPLQSRNQLEAARMENKMLKGQLNGMDWTAKVLAEKQRQTRTRRGARLQQAYAEIDSLHTVIAELNWMLARRRNRAKRSEEDRQEETREEEEDEESINHNDDNSKNDEQNQEREVYRAVKVEPVSWW
ncbi:uncharacterized protein I303_103942 [Kwoniella dejecticola CBS 10117]|uniref:Uncharacterized protein n=1 Tax=Kwoniella dejecticola CBS 10117 TaxID=1296121 RepID=A0A1A6A847_9TREE|nr:uncharacterized protein I303_03959 [Kwoniella dejecticola CBS 10117]OBR86239.1 hypothetical protein I303_03959 [Kwoniella dejecticola CBS 10117]